MQPLSPLSTRRHQSPAPATNPLGWLDAVELSPDEAAALREHIERLLHLDEEVR